MLVVGPRCKLTAYGVWLGNDIVSTQGTIALTIQLRQISLQSLSCKVVSIMSAIRGHPQQWRIRLLRINTALLVHHPRLAKQVTRVELKVEPNLA